MLIDVILIGFSIISLGYIIFVVIKKFPYLANINVKTIPEKKQADIKRQILEDKFNRDFGARWKTFNDSFLVSGKEKASGYFTGIYTKLKNLENEYRVAKKKDLSSQVSKTRSVEDLVALARNHLTHEEHKSAEQYLMEALKLDDHNTKVYNLLAQVYIEQDDFAHAEDTLQFLLQLTDYKDPTVFSSIASLAIDRGDLSKAQENYEKAIELDPEDYKYHLELAEVYNALGENEEAQSSAQKAHELAKNNPKILDFLIENSIILQDKTRAEEYIAKLIVVNPQNGKIQSFKVRIEKLGK